MENTLKKSKNAIIYDPELEVPTSMWEHQDRIMNMYLIKRLIKRMIFALGVMRGQQIRSKLDKATGAYPHELWDVADVYEETLDEPIS